MTFAGGVFDKVDVSRLKGDLLSARNFNLSSAAERDHVLAAWAYVPIGDRAGRSPAELGPGDWHHFENLTRVPVPELHLYLFGMRLLVRTRIEPSHEYGFVSLSVNHAMRSESRAD